MTVSRGALPPIVLALFAICGCGSGATIDVRYPGGASAGVASTVTSPPRVALGPIADRRVDPARIGSWPKDDGAIVTSRPVPDIVRDALAAELARNGYAVVSADSAVTVVPAVEAFWLDSLRAYPGRQYLGRVVVAVTVLDGTRGAVLFSRRYVGIRRLVNGEVSKAIAQDVMASALARAMHDLSTDRDLMAALARTGRAAAGSGPPAVVSR